MKFLMDAFGKALGPLERFAAILEYARSEQEALSQLRDLHRQFDEMGVPSSDAAIYADDPGEVELMLADLIGRSEAHGLALSRTVTDLSVQIASCVKRFDRLFRAAAAA